ncbi:unnamed protein product, partial [Hapterophycus canaliculatus]
MTNTSPSDTADRDCRLVDLAELISRFYASPETLAKFEAVRSVPAPFDELLDHNHHMTVTVEHFHKDLVDVFVHRGCLHGTNSNRCRRELPWCGRPD